MIFVALTWGMGIEGTSSGAKMSVSCMLFVFLSVKKMGNKLIALTGNMKSYLGEQADYRLSCMWSKKLALTI